MIEEGYVNYQKHPTEDLWIYNYSNRVQFDKMWNEITLMCRGLILDKEQNIVARPFQKFFNLEEWTNQGKKLPDMAFKVYEKLDGSLGILYWIGDTPYLATRGSFTSEQALMGTDLLHSPCYKKLWDKIDKTKTYLFEILYPENRIVVDYGTTRDIVLLAIIDNETGEDVELQDIGFPVVKKYDGITDIHKLLEINGKNREGFVIKYDNDFRLKLKYDEYQRLHRLLTCMNQRHVWDILRNNQPIDDLVNNVPDEFYNWIRDTIQMLKNNYTAIEMQCKHDFKNLGNRKQTAIYYQKCDYPNVLFMMLDGKDYSDYIWKLIKPSGTKVFKEEI